MSIQPSPSIQQQLEERFLRYVAISSQSDARQQCVPSTEGQRVLAQLLADELRTMGVLDCTINEHAIVTAKIPANTKQPCTAIGFVAHLDTVDVGLSAQIKPQKVHYTGQDIVLNAEKNRYFDKQAHPEIDRYMNDAIFFSDGTSVLGADDKAAIAVIMTLAEALMIGAIPSHGDIYIAFVPDEEIGLRGAKKLDLTRFCPDYAYTIDCCEQGELVFETFNAAQAHIRIEGVTAHPMSAKGVLVNAVLVAHDFIHCFDRKETPAHTEGREGYIHFCAITATEAKAHVRALIRDHDRIKFQQKKHTLQEAVDRIQARYPTAHVHCDIEDTYANIANTTDASHPAIQALYTVYEQLGITAKTLAMRGGTDGSVLSYRGLVTPNYFTGAHNFHSKYEFLPMSAFEKSYQVTERLVINVAEPSKA